MQLKQEFMRKTLKMDFCHKVEKSPSYVNHSKFQVK